MEQIEHREICGVPCIILEPSSEHVGQIVLYHGWGSTIESYKFFASLISNWRYRVIIPELPCHGERGSLNLFDEETLQTNFWPVVLQGVQEAEKIVSELVHNSDSPITVVGHSTGGFITAGIYAQHQQVQSAIVINGSCAWVQFEELYRETNGLKPMEDSDKNKLHQNDPLPYIQRNPAKPLLLLHCQDDTSIPIDSQKYFINAMSTAVKPADQIQLIEYPRVNHQITLGMLQKIKEFLDKTLLSG
ncbi:alpha/beta fold hydrolase [Paenibacillus chondroitinus]|uniref:Alpha/beta fold hydrolase n=1 Tax=Paenibacillus chondroitinus TaxID=59842 RepID=A0ABU6DN78_9BACL|nr:MULTISPECIES: alpha/beta fold hydrolase [Paenibacillus]MCY9663093.1 alpha/beta fold hydrolase [Paenibacillus anseongense]MEB4799234.1 alpha/beta fold hydrolase [Paenibacillus chondroitinus]